jgi:hypothetical protein
MTRKQSKAVLPAKRWAWVNKSGDFQIAKNGMDKSTGERMCSPNEHLTRVLIQEIPRKEKRRGR